MLSFCEGLQLQKPETLNGCLEIQIKSGMIGKLLRPVTLSKNESQVNVQ